MRGHGRPHPGQRRLLRCPDRLRGDQPPQGHQAGGWPVREGRRDAAPLRRGDPHRGRLRVHARPGADRRAVRGRPAGRRDRQVQGQGLRRRHEAAPLQGPFRLARHAAQAPLARLDRRVRHAVPRLQGRADGGPDGRRADHRAEPDRARRGRRQEPAADQGRRSRPARRARRGALRGTRRGTDEHRQRRLAVER